jgi:hypothetical protein
MKKAPAYWISPIGRILPIEGEGKHIDFVIESPETFKYTDEKIKSIYDKYGEDYGFEGKAREEIMLNLFKRGWIRIRHYKRNDFYSVNVKDFVDGRYEYIYDWANEMVKNGQKYSDVKIDTEEKLYSTTIQDIADDVLFKETSQFYLMAKIKDVRRFAFNKRRLIEVDNVKQLGLKESSLSRIQGFITDRKSEFGIISAFRGDNQEENLKKHAQLKQDVRSLKSKNGKNLGYIEQKAGYTYSDDGVYEEELSLFVPNIEFGDLIHLGLKYDQESVIYKDKDIFETIDTKSVDENGYENFATAKRFKYGKFSLKMKDIIEAYSTLLKGNHRKVKFAYLESTWGGGSFMKAIIYKPDYLPQKKYVRIFDA